MREYPINEQKTLLAIRALPRDQRLDLALDFIDRVIGVFVLEVVTIVKIQGLGKGNGNALFDICRQGLKGWKKICKREVVVRVDEEGYEYLLDPKTFPDYMMNRFQGTSQNKEDYDSASKTLTKIFDHLGWKYDRPEEWVEE